MATEIFGNRDCVSCEGGGWIVCFSSAGNSFEPCPTCNPNYEKLDNRFYRDKDEPLGHDEGTDGLRKAVAQNRKALGLPEKDMTIGDGMQLLISKGYSVKEICDALVELSKREKPTKG